MMKKNWTPAEDRLLAGIYPNLNNQEVAKQMNRSYGSIIGRASSLGLKKDPAYFHQHLMEEAQKVLKKNSIKNLPYEIRKRLFRN